jgi:hypothetical protein
MKQLLALLGFFFAYSPAQAWWAWDCLKATCPAIGCPPPAITWEEKTITCYKPVLKPRDVEFQITEPVLRPEIIDKKILVPKLDWSEHKIPYCEPKLVPREGLRDVICWRMETQVVTDQCTGCTRTICKPIREMKRVKVIVLDLVTEPKEMAVRTACLQTKEQTIQVRRFVLECKPVTVTRRVYDLELVPFEIKIRVPVCTFPPPCCQR